MSKRPASRSSATGVVRAGADYMDPALEKLRQALDEYLASGGDTTPVAAEAQALMQAIDGGAQPPDAGGLGDLGAAPPDAGASPEMGAAPPDMGADSELGGDMPPPQDAKTFEGARAGAKDRLKKLNRR